MDQLARRSVKGGQRIEFSIAEGRRGAQALSVRLLEPAPSVDTTVSLSIAPIGAATSLATCSASSSTCS